MISGIKCYSNCLICWRFARIPFFATYIDFINYPWVSDAVESRLVSVESRLVFGLMFIVLAFCLNPLVLVHLKNRSKTIEHVEVFVVLK